MPDSSRMTLDPDICHGKPGIRHLRWPVEVVLDLVSASMGWDEILAASRKSAAPRSASLSRGSV